MAPWKIYISISLALLHLHHNVSVLQVRDRSTVSNNFQWKNHEMSLDDVMHSLACSLHHRVVFALCPVSAFSMFPILSVLTHCGADFTIKLLSFTLFTSMK